MGRSVDRLASEGRAPLGRAGLRGLALVALAALGASAGDGDLPELTPPSDMPIVSKPSTTATPPGRAPAPAARVGSRPMLALPGLTTPPARATAPVPEPRPAPDQGPGELSLDAPLEMRPQAGATTLAPPRSARPPALESSPMGEPVPIDGGPDRPNSPPRRAASPAPPARRPRLFGLLPGQAPPPVVAPKAAAPGRTVVDGLRDDPAVDSALKRRIERQAREVVGARARSVEVKLSGKDAVVRVEGVKFLQKRAVRKQLEGIPALAGLRSTIEVMD